MHKETHAETKSHHFAFCNATFKTAAEVAKHVRVHSLTKPYICGICNAAYKSSMQFKKNSLRRKAGSKATS